MATIVEGRLSGRIAVVTGAANGIGRASALRLAREGADLAVVDREGEALHAVGRAIEELGRPALAITADWTDAVAVGEAFAAIRRRFGRIDILFNNVGQSARERASEFHMSEEETWRFVIEVSLLTTMRATPARGGGDAGPQERPHREHVDRVRLLRRRRLRGLRRGEDGRRGLHALARPRAGAVSRINVNAVCPGAIRTRAHDRLPMEVIDRVRTSVPMGYVAEPEDVAGVVAFLASDDARYITGQSILIDGGRWMI